MQQKKCPVALILCHREETGANSGVPPPFFDSRDQALVGQTPERATNAFAQTEVALELGFVSNKLLSRQLDVACMRAHIQ